MRQDSSLQELYDITTYDPLFAAEGLDLDNASFALDAMTEIAEKLEILDQSKAGLFYFFQHPLNETLHPFRFLRSFLVSEKQRRHFLADPTLVAAKNLIASYYKTVKSLEKDLKAYRNAYISLQKKSKSKFQQNNSYNFYHQKVSFTDIVNSIDLMLLNAQQLRKEIDTRNRLLLSIMKNSLLGKKNISKSEHKPIRFVLPLDTIPQKKAGTKNKRFKEISSFLKDNWIFKHYALEKYAQLDIEEIGPIYYELSQFDTKPTTHEFYVGIVKDKSNSPRFMFTLLTDQYHFLELARDKYKFPADIFTYEPLIKKGIYYWYQPATMFYFTHDLTYYPDLATIVDLKRRPYLNEKLVLRQKSSMLDLLLWNGYFHNLSYLRNITARIKAEKKGNLLHYLIVGRSYPSLYFLSFNKSVWRISQKPNFLGTTTHDSSYYVTLDKISKRLSKKDLEKIFKGAIIRAQDVDEYISDFKK